MRTAHGGRLAAWLLLGAPLVIYLALYLAPLFSFLSLSVDNGTLSKRFVQLSHVVNSPDPDKRAAALLADLDAMDPKDRAEAARMFNQELSGMRSLVIDTGKAAKTIAPNMAGLVAFNAKWGEQATWDVLSRNVEPYTARHFQKATGFKPDAQGKLTIAEGDDIYLRIMVRTLVIGLQVTFLTLIIGYPLAYGIANGSGRLASFLLMVVVLSFWTSILVRTTAWVVLLNNNGIINGLLTSLHIVSGPVQLIFNRFGVVVSMTHVLLPFAILPMMNVMKTIPKSQSDASRSLGAGPIETFLRVYFPQSLRGVLVGGGAVFILSLGFYVTPALTGGPGDQMLSYYIAEAVKKSLNWGLASVLSLILLLSVGVLLLVGVGLRRLFNMKPVEV